VFFYLDEGASLATSRKKRNKTMNCPRCEKYIVPEFYCINCGYVPTKIQDHDPHHMIELEIPMTLSGR
jgi:ribosomal protein L37E